MRATKRIHILSLAVVACLALASIPAWAQATAQIKGKVTEAGTGKPLIGATVDIYRTDEKASFNTKTGAGGAFTQAVPKDGTYIVVVSAASRAPKLTPNVKPATNPPDLTFALDAGDGKRPSLEEVNKVLSGEADAEYEKQVQLKSQFDAKKAHFDTGVKAMADKDYTTAISAFTSSLEGLENADPEYWNELINAAGGNLAEVEYRVAVDKFNAGSRDEAKSLLERGAKAIAMAIKANPAEPVNYAIQGKTLLLLVSRFDQADLAETGAQAFLKAAEMQTTDKKQQVDFIVKAGDVYRAAYMTDPAISTYKRALGLDPNNISALYGIGLAAMATSEADDAKRKAIYQTAADYLKVFVDKAGTDPRANEAKGVLDTLAKDFKIKPRPLK